MLGVESAHRRSDKEQLNNRPLIGLLSQVLHSFDQHASPSLSADAPLMASSLFVPFSHLMTDCSLAIRRRRATRISLHRM